MLQNRQKKILFNRIWLSKCPACQVKYTSSHFDIAFFVKSADKPDVSNDQNIIPDIGDRSIVLVSFLCRKLCTCCKVLNVCPSFVQYSLCNWCKERKNTKWASTVMY